MKQRSLDKTDLIIVLVLFALASVLILSNLGGQCLWQDEAQTGCIARTILTHGVPLGYDGTNHFSQNLGKEYGKDYLWIWHPWFPFYLLAAFYRLFGVSTLTSRLPFALLGIVSVILMYYQGKSLWRSRRAGVYSAVLLLMSVPFLLLVRQCRYYAPEILFSMLGLYAYHLMLEKRRSAVWLLAVSAFLLFHTHYVQCAVLLGTAILHSAGFRRDQLKPLVLLTVAMCVLNAPMIAIFSQMRQVIHDYGSTSQRGYVLGSHLAWMLVKYSVSPVTAVVLAFMLWRHRGTRAFAVRSNSARIIVLLVLYCLLTLTAATVTAEGGYYRYVAPALPAICLLSAFAITHASRRSVIVGAVLLAGAACSPVPPRVISIDTSMRSPTVTMARLTASWRTCGRTRRAATWWWPITRTCRSSSTATFA